MISPAAKSIILFTALMLAASAGHAGEEKYFYKVYGKELNEKAHDDQYYILKGREGVFPEDVFFFIYLPRPQDDYYPVRPFTLYFHVATASLETHYFTVDYLGLRDFEKPYLLRLRDPQVSPFGDLYEKLDAYFEEEGIIYSKHEVPFRRGEYIQKLVDFEPGTPLPEKMYLEYRFRIRRENGLDLIMEDSLPLELATYKT